MLTPEDAAAVLRRAAELDTPSLEQHDALDEQVVREAAREVGLSEGSVEQAVSEWRAGLLAPLPELPPDRVLGLRASVVVEMQVALAPDVTARRVEAWLQTQWFERRRTRGAETDWRPRPGLLAAGRRAIDLGGTLRLTRVARLATCLAPATGGTRVRLVADLSDLRVGLLAGLVVTPGVLAGAATAVAAPLAFGGPMPEVLLALPAALGAGGVGWLASSGLLAAHRGRVSDELEQAVSRLEHYQAPTPLPQRAVAWVLQRRLR